MLMAQFIDPYIPLVDFLRHPPTPPPESYQRPSRSSATRFELANGALSFPYLRSSYGALTLPKSASVISKSAYSFFVDQRKIDVHYAQQDIEYRVITFYDECEVIWEETPLNEKERFFQMAEVDRQRVADLMAPNERDQLQFVRERPRRPKGPFRVFCGRKTASVKARYPNCSIGFLMHTLSQMWNRAPGRLKEDCENEAVEDRLRYQDEIAAFENGHQN